VPDWVDSDLETRAKALLISVIGTVAAVGMLALTVYPSEYGAVESAVLAGASVLAALFKYVLDTGLTS